MLADLSCGPRAKAEGGGRDTRTSPESRKVVLPTHHNTSSQNSLSQNGYGWTYNETRNLFDLYFKGPDILFHFVGIAKSSFRFTRESKVRNAEATA